LCVDMDCVFDEVVFQNSILHHLRDSVLLLVLWILGGSNGTPFLDIWAN